MQEQLFACKPTCVLGAMVLARLAHKALQLVDQVSVVVRKNPVLSNTNGMSRFNVCLSSSFKCGI